MGYLLKVMAKDYNDSERKHIDYIDTDTVVSFPCTIKGFLSQTYGKFGLDTLDSQIIMEYNQLFPYVIDYIPETLSKHRKFVTWLS